VGVDRRARAHLDDDKVALLASLDDVRDDRHVAMAALVGVLESATLEEAQSVASRTLGAIRKAHGEEERPEAEGAGG
jgi:hypothetical protein